MTHSAGLNLTPPWNRGEEDEYEKFSYLLENFTKLRDLTAFDSISVSFYNISPGTLAVLNAAYSAAIKNDFDMQMTLNAATDPYNVHAMLVNEYGDYIVTGDPARLSPNGYAVPPAGQIRAAVFNNSASVQSVTINILIKERN